MILRRSMTLVALGCLMGVLGCPADPDGTPDAMDATTQDQAAVDGSAEVQPDAGEEDALAEVDADDDAGADTTTDAPIDSADGGEVAPSGSYKVTQLNTGLPTEYVFKDLWASQPGLAVAVGNDGVVATYDGQAWTGNATGNAELLNAVHGFGPNDVWAVGKSGAVLRGSATTGVFNVFDAPGATLPTLWGVSALAPNNIVGVGLGGTIARFDGTQWNPLSGPGQAGIDWNGMTGSGGLVVLVGAGGAIGVLGGGGLELPSSNVTSDLFDVDSQGTTFVAVGAFGTVVKGDGTLWTPMLGVPTAATLRGVFVESPSSIYAVGDSGTALHYNGVAWSALSTGTFVSLDAVHVSASGAITMTGGDGVVVTGTLADGLSVTDTLSVGSALTAIWGHDEDVVIVGDGAKVYTGGPPYTLQSTPITQNLRDVWGSAPDDVWAVGLLGKLIHWDGSTWTEVDSSVFDQLEAVWGNGPDDVFAAGSGGALLHYDGTVWSKLASNTTENLRDVFALNDQAIWAVGSQGTIMFFDGLGWNQQPITPEVDADGNEVPYTDELHGVWASAPDNAWAVGANGQVVHWDGSAWTSQKLTFGITLRGVFGRGADRVWAVGNQGHMLVYNGEDWQTADTGSIATLYAIDGALADDGQLFVTGDIGTILSVQWVPDP